MSDVVDLKAKIKTALEAIVESGGSTRKIKIVYNYPESKPSGYPYSYISYTGDESEVLTNVEDAVTYEFEINTVQEKFEDLKGRENAEATAEAMAFDINEKLRGMNKLALSDVLRITPIETVKSYVEGNTRIALKTVVKVQTVELISTTV